MPIYRVCGVFCVLVMNDLVLIAYIAKAVGLKGALKLKLLNSQSESLRPGLKLSIR